MDSSLIIFSSTVYFFKYITLHYIPAISRSFNPPSYGPHMLCVPVLQRYVQTTWPQKAMVTLIDYPAPMELFSKAGELRMPFSDVVKYCILGISIILLLLALGILAWQIYRFCTEKYTTYTQQDAGE